MKVKPALWMAMIETAEIVAERYHVSRDRQDAYALESQRRTAAAQQGGRFKDEIVPLATRMKKVDRASGQETIVDVTVESRRRQSARYDAGRSERAETRVQRRAASSARQIHHRGKRFSVRRRSLGRRRDGRRGSRQTRHQAARHFPRIRRWPVASRTRWASDLSSPCRAFLNVTD